MSIDNTGRDIYLHEIIIDFLKNTEEYSDENIRKKLQLYYNLQKKQNEEPLSMVRDERIQLKHLKKFFSKTFEISFASSNLVYPRFKEAYLTAKSAIANLKTAYDNVVSEYYKIANKGYYEYKDPKYLKYLEYIKKKIILAKVNAGLLDYTSVAENTDNTDNKYNDENVIEGKDLKIEKVKDKEVPPKSDHTDTGNFKTTPQTSKYTDNKPTDIKKATPTETTKALAPTAVAEKNTNTSNDGKGNNSKGNNSKGDNSKGDIVMGDTGKGKDKDFKQIPFMLQPPPLFEDIGAIQNTMINIPDLGKYLLPPPPLLLGGGDNDNKKDDFSFPKTIPEQYEDEKVFMTKVLTEYDDITYINKNIESIITKITEINEFIYGVDNNKTNSLEYILNPPNNLADPPSNISNKKLEIEAYIESKKSFESLITELGNYNEKLKGFLDKTVPELFKKDKDIYTEKIKDIKSYLYGENGNERLDKIISLFIKEVSVIFDDLLSLLKTYKSKFETKESEIKKDKEHKNKIEELNAKKQADIEKATEIAKAKKDGEKNGGSGEDIENKIKTKIARLKGDKQKIEKNITSLKTSFGEIKGKIESKTKDPMMKTALFNSQNSEGTSLFDSIWKKYVTDLKDEKKLIENTEDKLYENIKNNDLDPIVVLELTIEDRIIFIVISYFIRQFSLGIIEYFIDDGKIKDIIYSLIFYVICYSLILIIFVIIINLDSYKLRILFNYLNFHVNSSGIYMHLFIVSIFTFLIYFLIVNINFPIQNINQNYISESDKLKLSYRLDILTMIIYLFSSVVILLV